MRSFLLSLLAVSPLSCLCCGGGSYTQVFSSSSFVILGLKSCQERDNRTRRRKRRKLKLLRIHNFGINGEKSQRGLVFLCLNSQGLISYALGLLLLLPLFSRNRPAYCPRQISTRLQSTKKYSICDEGL